MPDAHRFQIRDQDPHPLVFPATMLTIGAGVILLAWVGWLIWYDITTWQKSLDLILLGSRLGEVMSLGIGAKAIHYVLLGVALLPVGVIVLVMESVKSVRINEGRHEIRYAEASGSSPSQLNARITMAVINNGMVPVTLHDMDVELALGSVKATSLFFKGEGFTVLPRSEREFVIGCRVMGEEADALYKATEYHTRLMLQGNASATFYKTAFVHEAEGMRRTVHAEE
jgi:hypothetical protein